MVDSTSLLRRAAFWAAIVASAWIAAIVLLAWGDEMDLTCRSGDLDEQVHVLRLRDYWAGGVALGACAASIGGGILARGRRGVFIVSAVASLGLAVTAMIVSALEGVTCGLD